MYTMHAVQAGFVRWSEQLLANAPADGRKSLTAMLALVNFRLPVIINNFNRRPEVAIMGFLDENGDVDVDGLRGAGQILARSGLLTIKLPTGKFDFSEADVNSLCDFIEGEV